ncbi:hypothetical protein [Candidatus Pristimantibacillus sp. PTI5]|uniref:hypothetical protein n=1 Tax=Candidatus Pristimantibacillus sp. PTI5 TaxID=3400422 RepID=UPI003B018638
MKKRMKIFTAFSVLSLTFTLASSVYAEKPIPQYVKDKVETQVKASEYQLPKVQAWETDMNGNTVKVIPLSERVTTSDGISALAVPNDGYIYAFDRYDPNGATRNWKYRNAGIFRVVNGLSTISKVTYTQQSTTEVTWSVNSSISGSSTVGNGFLAGITLEYNIGVDRAKTWTKGQQYGVEQEIPAKTTAYLTNYQVGVNSNGILYYKKYAPGGTSQVGVYQETAGGTVISKNDVSIVITATEPAI